MQNDLARKISVMQAFERGEKVERYVGFDTWEEIPKPTWNWHDCDYRITPKAKRKVKLQQWLCGDATREYWITIYLSGRPPNAIEPYGDPVVVEVDCDE